MHVEKKVKISDRLIFFWRDGHFVCDNYELHIQKSINFKFIPIINWFSTWKSVETISELLQCNLELDELETRAVILQFIDTGIFIYEDKCAEDYKDSINEWDYLGTSVKYFHYNSRSLENETYQSTFEHLSDLIARASLIPPPEIYKNYPSCNNIKLPLPIYMQDNSFLNVLMNRQTIRSFDSIQSLSINNLSTILYYVWGATSCWVDKGIGRALLKTSPSGGSRHSIEVYPCIFNVKGIPPGFYHYSVKDHELHTIEKGDFRNEVVTMCGGQPHVGTPSAIFIYTSVLERLTWKYQTPRTYKVLMIDLGHLSQTLYLVSSWLGLGAFFTAAVKEGLLEQKLHLNSEKEIVIGVSGVGQLSNAVLKEGSGGRFVRDDLR